MVCGREGNQFSPRKRDFDINSISGWLLAQYAQFLVQQQRIGPVHAGGDGFHLRGGIQP